VRSHRPIDPRVVVNPAQARQLLAAVTYVGGRRRRDRGARLPAYSACLYYGGPRPGEAQNLRTNDLDLPPRGVGSPAALGLADRGQRVVLRPVRRPVPGPAVEAAQRGGSPSGPAGPRRDPARTPRRVSAGPGRRAVRRRRERWERGLTAGPSALRPPTRGAVELAGRRGATHRGRHPRGQPGHGAAPGPRPVPRRPAGHLPRPDLRAARVTTRSSSTVETNVHDRSVDPPDRPARPAPPQTTRRRRPCIAAGHDAVPAVAEPQPAAFSRARRSLRRISGHTAISPLNSDNTTSRSLLTWCRSVPVTRRRVFESMLAPTGSVQPSPVPSYRPFRSSWCRGQGWRSHRAATP